MFSGKANYDVGDSGIIVKYANGTPIIALAAVFQHNPLVSLSLQSSWIISPYEMADKRVMYTASGNDDSPLGAMLTEAGLGEGEYHYLPQSFENIDLIQSKVDVVTAYLSRI